MEMQEDQYVSPLTEKYNYCAQKGLVNAGILNKVAGKEPDVQHLRTQMRLIIEEINETIDAIEKHDVAGIRDGAADIRVVVTGYVYLASWSYQQLAMGELIEPEWPANHAPVELCANQLKTLRDDLVYMVEQYLDSDFAHITGPIPNKLLTIQALATLVTHISGYDPQVDDELVFVSNMSKFDMVRQNAEDRAEEYRQQGAVVEVREVSVDEHTYYPIVVSENCEIDGKAYPKGKFLKSNLFKSPQW